MATQKAQLGTAELGCCFQALARLPGLQEAHLGLSLGGQAAAAMTVPLGRDVRNQKLRMWLLNIITAHLRCEH